MNYKLFSQLREVYSFSIENKTLFTASTKGHIRDTENVLIYTCLGKFAPILKVIKGVMCFYDNGQVFYDIEKLVFKKYIIEEYKQSSIDPHSSYFDGQTIMMLKDFDQKRLFGLFDVENAILIWVKPYHISIKNHINLMNIFTSTTSSDILCLGKKNGSLFWQTDLGVSYPSTKIQQIIGVWENQLLVWLESNQIVSLDINEGQILWDLPNFDEHFSMSGKGWSYGWHLENGKLYVLRYWQYFSIDLNTQAVTLLWENPNKSYNIRHCTYIENYVYFTAIGKEIEISILGVFNRKTLQIDWLEKMTMPRIDHYCFVGFNQAPQVSENKLYVLDSGGTLHIFEREE